VIGLGAPALLPLVLLLAWLAVIELAKIATHEFPMFFTDVAELALIAAHKCRFMDCVEIVFVYLCCHSASIDDRTDVPIERAISTCVLMRAAFALAAFTCASVIANRR
jgi:hypothetical protein